MRLFLDVFLLYTAAFVVGLLVTGPNAAERD